MALLSDKEARSATDSFLRSVYGEDVFLRWKALKKEMLFESERDYVCWLMDVAFHYKGGGDGFGTDSGDDIANLTANDTTEDGGDVTYDGAAEGFPDHTAAVKREASDMFHLGETKHKHKRRNESEFPSAEQDATFEAEMSGAEFCDYGAAEADGAAGASGDHAVSLDGEAAVGNMEIINYAQGNEDCELVMDTAVAIPSEMKRYNCQFCNFSTNYSSSLENHVRAIHERRKPFTCNFCTYSGSQKASLYQHLVLKHGYKSNFSCQKCGKCVTSKHSLQNHERACKS